MHDWPIKTLAEVAVILMGQSPPGTTYNTLGQGLPFLQGSAEFGDNHPTPVKYCSAPAKIAELGDLMVSVRAPVGDSNIADQRLAVGRGLAVIRGKEGVLTQYLRLVIQAGADELLERSGTGMFTSITAANLRAVAVPCPAPGEQRRIVDLIGALDALVIRDQAAGAAAEDLLVALLGDHAAAVTGQARRVVDCCAEVVGGIWGRPAGEADVDVAALGPRIYAPGTPGFTVTGSPLRSFTARQVTPRLVREGDIILERSGGSPGQPVGRVVAADGREGPCVPTDFQRLLRPDPDVVAPRYLFWRLWHDWRSGVTTGYSRRTTGITNLAVPAYLDRLMSLPSPEEQHGVAALADAASEVVHATRSTTASLAQLRARLLDAVLGGDLQLSEQYDRLLEAT